MDLHRGFGLKQMEGPHKRAEAVVAPGGVQLRLIGPFLDHEIALRMLVVLAQVVGQAAALPRHGLEDEGHGLDELLVLFSEDVQLIDHDDHGTPYEAMETVMSDVERDLNGWMRIKGCKVARHSSGRRQR
jgi:hypothetical protein